MGELILAIAYGYEVQGRHDRRVDIARRLAKLASETVLPGALLVNDLPFCKSSPLAWTHSAVTGSISTIHP
jgi:hypothetical protein